MVFLELQVWIRGLHQCEPDDSEVRGRKNHYTRFSSFRGNSRDTVFSTFVNPHFLEIMVFCLPGNLHRARHDVSIITAKFWSLHWNMMSDACSLGLFEPSIDRPKNNFTY